MTSGCRDMGLYTSNRSNINNSCWVFASRSRFQQGKTLFDDEENGLHDNVAHRHVLALE